MRAPVVTLCAALAGCNLAPYDLSSATADASTATTTSTSLDPTDATSTGDPPSTFIKTHDLPDHPPGWCTVWDDTCPIDQKCTAVSLDGDSDLESLRCVPLSPTPDGVNEPCTILGDGRDGLDTCSRGLACKFYSWGTHLGTCIGFCTGSPEQPVCADPQADCKLTDNAVGDLCYSPCDPLAQDCDDGAACLPLYLDVFTCVSDGSGDEGQVFDVCEYGDACDPGLLCANPSLATECDPNGAGCCLPFCDTSQPNTCPGAGQECLAWFDDGWAPPEHERVGVCGLP
jgi:hypothetical protein